MIAENMGANVVMPPVATATNTTTQMSFSKINKTNGQAYDHAVIDVILSTHASTTTVLQTLILAESDTVTSPTSMTDIVAFSGASATSTTYGFAIPAIANTDTGGVIELQVDLRLRKKYIGLKFYGSSATCTVAALVKLTRGKASDDTATLKQQRNYGNTAAAGCLTLVTDKSYTTVAAPTS